MPSPCEITSAGSGDSVLKGCLIIKVTGGWQLKKGSRLLATAGGTTLPSDFFFLEDPTKPTTSLKWTVTAKSLSGDTMMGDWGNHKLHSSEGESDEGDSWTASGTGLGEGGEEETQAAAAK